MLGTLVLCVFLFAEETGLPLPLAPGEVFLVSAGVLIRSGAISPWSFLPLAILSVTAGATVGFSWARLVGAGGIRALAGRLHVGHRLERFEQRLRSASPPGIFVARLLIPGMRVNTTLLAGALGVSRRVFTIGLVPSVIVWTAAVTSLGVAVGTPAERFLGALDQVAAQALVLAAVGLAGYVAARHAPSRHRDRVAMLRPPGPGQIALAVAVDVTAVAAMVAGIRALGLGLVGICVLGGVLVSSLTVGISLVGFVVAGRWTIGGTTGETLFRVSYRSAGGSGVARLDRTDAVDATPSLGRGSAARWDRPRSRHDLPGHVPT